MQAEQFHHWVALEREQVVGYLAFKAPGHLYHLFVAQPFQRLGIARQLWNKASNICRASQITLRSSMHAVEFYRTLGFKQAGDRTVKDGIVYVPMVLYRGAYGVNRGISNEGSDD